MAEDQIFTARANARDVIAGPGLPRYPGPPATPAGPAARTRPPIGHGQARQAAPARTGVMTGHAKTSSSRKET